MYIWPFKIAADDEQVAEPAQAATEHRTGAGLPDGLRQFLLQRLPRHRVVLPGDANYLKARRTFNERFNHLRPWAVILCEVEEDLRACLEGVRSYKVPFRIRAGGHSFAGFSSIGDGMVIDVSGFNKVQVDPARLEASVGGGCKMKALQAGLGGLQLPMANDPVGVSGYMQGGGFDDNSRTYGMNSDNVLAVRVMLADGRVVPASETVNHDLWWAVRGGTGGNFGVLLEVRYALHRAPEQHAWSFFWPITKPADRALAAEVLLALQNDVLHGAGPQLNAAAELRRWPQEDGGPPAIFGLLVAGTYFGPEADMQALLRPLAQLQGERNFVQPAASAAPIRVLRQARFVSELGLPHWQTLVDDFEAHANLNSTLTLAGWGGAISAYPVEKSAFIHRSAALNIYVTGFWRDDQEELKMQAYLARWRSSVAPFWNGGIYQNFADADCPDYRSSYWGDAFPALLAVKRKYDPNGLFRFAQAIEARPGGQPPAVWPPTVVAWLNKPIEQA